jgi:ribosomal-protein-alanine N-acetyltransferase
MTVAPIRSRRLVLVSLSPDMISAALAGELHLTSGRERIDLPAGWAADKRRLLQLRLAQMDRDPTTQRWLLRAIRLRRGGPEMVGHIGFHAPPDDTGAVEIGYTVFAQHRRRGFALEAVEAMFTWAEQEGDVRRFIASIAPDNVASLSLAGRLGFVRVGSQWDEIDGEEHVFALTR